MMRRQKYAISCHYKSHLVDGLLADDYLDLVSRRLHIQVRLMANLCFVGGVALLSNNEGSLYLICKENIETMNHHFFGLT